MAKTDIKQALADFEATLNAGKKYSIKDWRDKFPEFNGNIQAAADYVATKNSGKYDNATLQSKFPEFFGTNVATQEQPDNSGSIVADLFGNKQLENYYASQAAKESAATKEKIRLQSNAYIPLTPEQEQAEQELIATNKQPSLWKGNDFLNDGADAVPNAIKRHKEKIDSLEKKIPNINSADKEARIEQIWNVWQNTESGKAAKDEYEKAFRIGSALFAAYNAAKYKKDVDKIGAAWLESDEAKKIEADYVKKFYDQNKDLIDGNAYDADKILVAQELGAKLKDADDYYKKAHKIYVDNSYSIPNQRGFVNKNYRGDLRNAELAKEQLSDAKKIVDAATNNSGFWRGMGDTFTDLDTWVSTKGLLDNLEIKAIAEKVDSGKPLTESEQKVMDAVVMNAAVNAYYSSDLSRGYKAGTTTALSIPFIIEFALLPMGSGSKAISRGIVKYAGSRFMRQGLKGAAKRETGIKMLGDLMGGIGVAAGKTVTVDMPKVLKNVTERELGQFDFNIEDGNVNYNGRDGIDDGIGAYGRALASTFNENFSEMAFAPFGRLKMSEKLGKLVPWWAHRIKTANPSELTKILNEINDFRKAAHIGGIVEETAEEELNNLLNGLVEATGSDNFAEALGKEYSNAFSLDSQIDLVLGLAASQVFFSGMGVASHTANKVHQRVDRKVISNYFGDDFVRRMERFEQDPQKMFGLLHGTIKQILENDSFKTADGKTVECKTQEQKRKLISQLVSVQQVQMGMLAQRQEQQEQTTDSPTITAIDGVPSSAGENVDVAETPEQQQEQEVVPETHGQEQEVQETNEPSERAEVPPIDKSAAKKIYVTIGGKEYVLSSDTGWLLDEDGNIDILSTLEAKPITYSTDGGKTYSTLKNTVLENTLNNEKRFHKIIPIETDIERESRISNEQAQQQAAEQPAEQQATTEVTEGMPQATEQQATTEVTEGMPQPAEQQQQPSLPVKKDGTPDYDKMDEKQRYAAVTSELGEERARAHMVARSQKVQSDLTNLEAQRKSVAGTNQEIYNERKIKQHQQTLQELTELFNKLGIEMPTAEQAKPAQIQQPQTEQAQQTTEVTAPAETIDVPQTEATADVEQRTQGQEQPEQEQVVEPTTEQVEAEQDEKGKATEKPKWYDEAMSVIRDKNGYVTEAELEGIVQLTEEAAENDDLPALAKQINEDVIDLSSNKSGIAENAYKKKPTEANRRAYIEAQITDAIGDIVSDRVNNVLQRYPIDEMTQDELQNEFDFLYRKIGRDKATSLQLRQKDIENMLGRNNTNTSHNERKKERTAAAQEREVLQEQRRMGKEAEKRSREKKDKELLAKAKQYTENILGSLTDDGRLDDFVILETKRKYPTFIFVPKSEQQAYKERFGYKQVDGAFEIVYDEKGEPAGIMCKNRKALIGHDSIATGANVRLEYLFDSTGRRLKATNEEQKVEILKKFYKAETLEAILDSKIPTNNKVSLREILAMDSPGISNLCKDIYLKHPEMFKNVDESEAVETLRSRIKEDIGALNVLIDHKGLFQFGKNKQNIKRLENYLNQTATMGQESNRNEINQKNYDREIAEYKQKRMLGKISQEEYGKVRNKLLNKYPHERTDSKDKATPTDHKAVQKTLSQAEANALRDELDLLESTRNEQPDLFTLDDKKRMDEINELLKDAPADTRYEDYEFSIVSDSEAAEIRRRAEADGTFMRAPNGKPTRLTERQWLQVRTRAFKEWFGDWELAAKKRFLLNGKTVSELTGNEFEKKDGVSLTEQVAEYFDSIGGKAVSPIFGEVTLDRKGAEDSLAHGMGRLKAVAYAGVKDVIEQGIVIDSDTNHKGRGYDSVVVAAPIKIGETEYVCSVVITIKDSDKRFYLHEITPIQKLQDAVSITNSGQSPTAHLGDLAKVLQKIVTASDDVSKVVDENGEPLVVYHGSKSIFSVFDTNGQQGTKTENTGAFFTDNRRVAVGYSSSIDDISEEDFAQLDEYGESYGGGIYPTFLNIRNPLSVECNGNSWDDVYGERWQVYNEYGDVVFASGSEYECQEYCEKHGDESLSVEPNEWGTTSTDEIIRYDVKNSEYDGAVFENIVDNADSYEISSNVYVVLNPSQIKSATDNVGTFDSTNDDIRFDRRDTETEADTAARREATEAVLQLLRDAGVKVELVDESALWDMADAALEAKRKRSAPETAELTPEGEAYATVVSNADGAKILKNIDTLAKEYENNNPTRPKTFIGDIANALGAERKGASNYVVFNESDLHITDHVQWLRGRDGVAYGAAVGDRIILNRERLNPNTPIHEYTHLWDAACRRTNPELWRRGVELMRQTSLWDEVKNDPNYSHLQSDDAIASEVHSRLAGRDGAALLDRLQREASTENAMDMVEHLGLVARLKRWLHDFWQWTKDTFAPWSTAEAARVTTDDFVLMPLADLVRGKNPSNARQLEQTNDIDTNSKKLLELLDKGISDDVSLQALSNVLNDMKNDLRRGDKPLLFDRFSHEELESGLERERGIAEALTIVSGRGVRAGSQVEYAGLQQALKSEDENIAREARIARDELNEQMENDIENYARAKGIWIDNTNETLRERYGDRLASGDEGVVYSDEANGRVVKSQSTWTYGTLQDKLDAIVLHNYLFPDTAYKLEGFGLGKDGSFQVVVSQPYVVSNGEKLTQDELDDFARSLGFEKDTDGQHNYTNGRIQLRDLHNENVMRTKAGNIRVIDNVIRFSDSADSTADDIRFDIERATDDISGSTMPMPQQQRIMTKKWGDWLDRLYSEMLYMNHILSRITHDINKARKRHGKKPLPTELELATLASNVRGRASGLLNDYKNNEGKELMQSYNALRKEVERKRVVSGEEAYDMINAYLLATDYKERVDMQLYTDTEAIAEHEQHFANAWGKSSQDFIDEFNSEFGSYTRDLWLKINAATKYIREIEVSSRAMTQERKEAQDQRDYYIPQRNSSDVMNGAQVREFAKLNDITKEEAQAALDLYLEAKRAQLEYESGLPENRDKLNQKLSNDKKIGSKFGTNINKYIKAIETTLPAGTIRDEYEGYYGTEKDEGLRKAGEGRSTLSDKPLENIEWILKQTVNKAAQREVTNALLDVARTDEGRDILKANGIIITPQYERKDQSKGNVPTDEEIKEYLSDKEAIESYKENCKRILDDELAQGKITESEYQKNLDEVEANAKEYENELTLKENDIEHNAVKNEIVFSSNEVFYLLEAPQKFINALRNRYGYHNYKYGFFGKLSRVYSRTQTEFNPFFAPTNLIRDYTTVLQQAIVEDPILAMHILKGATKNWRTIWRYTLNGNIDTSTEAGKRLKEFIKQGGRGGYAFGFTEKQVLEKEINDILLEYEIKDKVLTEKIKDGFKNLGELLSFKSRLTELFVRFNTYNSAIECGYSDAEALKLSKEINVNFDNRGFRDYTAVDIIYRLFRYFNPQVQALRRFIRHRVFARQIIADTETAGGRSKSSKAGRIIRSYCLMGLNIGLGALTTWLRASSFGGDDDDEEDNDLMSKQKKNAADALANVKDANGESLDEKLVQKIFGMDIYTPQNGYAFGNIKIPTDPIDAWFQYIGNQIVYSYMGWITPGEATKNIAAIGSQALTIIPNKEAFVLTPTFDAIDEQKNAERYSNGLPLHITAPKADDLSNEISGLVWLIFNGDDVSRQRGNVKRDGDWSPKAIQGFGRSLFPYGWAVANSITQMFHGNWADKTTGTLLPFGSLSSAFWNRGNDWKVFERNVYAVERELREASQIITSDYYNSKEDGVSPLDAIDAKNYIVGEYGDIEKVKTALKELDRKDIKNKAIKEKLPLWEYEKQIGKEEAQKIREEWGDYFLNYVLPLYQGLNRLQKESDDWESEWRTR